jgi:hypothetical protein
MLYACGTTSAAAPGRLRTGQTAEAAQAKALLDRADAALKARHLDEAKELIERAGPLALGDPKLGRRAVDLAIAVAMNQGKYEDAVRATLAAIRRRAADRSDPDLFVFHNWMAILREAQGDIPSALLECAERTAAGYEGTWEPAAERLKEARLKDDWHRAYLFRIYAEQVSGSKREAALLAAEKARNDYVAAGGYPESSAVLDAFFAMHDGRGDDARAAAQRVDIEKDDDEEDLYLLFSAFDAAGDKQAASAVRRRMEGLPPSWVLWRTWLQHDTDDSPKERRFSPRYPMGRPERP